MDSLINAGKEYLSEQLSGSGSGSHQGQGQGQGQGMCRNPSTIVIAIIINPPQQNDPDKQVSTACVAILEANKHLRRPTSSRKQSVTIPPHRLLPNEYPVLTRSSRFSIQMPTVVPILPAATSTTKTRSCALLTSRPRSTLALPATARCSPASSTPSARRRTI